MGVAWVVLQPAFSKNPGTTTFAGKQFKGGGGAMVSVCNVNSKIHFILPPCIIISQSLGVEGNTFVRLGGGTGFE